MCLLSPARIKQNVLHIYFFAKEAYVLKQAHAERSTSMVNFLQIIKETVESIQDIETRKRLVCLLNTQGHNNLHKNDQKPLPYLDDLDVRNGMNLLRIRLGLRDLSDAGEEVSKLLFGAKLNDNEDLWTVFFCENV